MAKKKVYAVRKGNKTGLFTSWSECEAAVKGFSGAEFKGFFSREEALDYLEGHLPQGIADAGEMPPDPDRDVIAYVDGSYDKESGRYSYGCVFLTPDNEVVRKSGIGPEGDSAKLRNVSGEMLGAMEAVQWAIAQGYASIELRYDYEGIEKWVTGAWQAKNPYTAAYSSKMRDLAKQIRISFWKVMAHTGNRYNEEADQLAKQALGLD